MKRTLGNTLFTLALALVVAASCSDPAPGVESACPALEVGAGPPPVIAAQDPGPRAGSARAGGYYPTLSAGEQAVFAQALERFQEVDSVSGAVSGESGVGLGPTFNGNSCAMCHAQPAVGGSSPGLRSPQRPIPNPQLALATLDGATNIVPPFVTADGPVREARFVSVAGADGAARDGSVHDLFTIRGRKDAIGCELSQPDFASELATGNVIFRIPTPLFGLGLVEDTPDATLATNLAADAATKCGLGIAGRFNTSANDGTITRFGWKAQNKSLLVFAGEAYNVEQGVSNEAFPNERSAAPGCVFNATPEDSTSLTNPSDGTASTTSSDVVNFALFARLSAPPAPAPFSPSAEDGQALFARVGCAQCHTPSLTTGASPFTGMSRVTYHPYSDFALHRMGTGLADGVEQGAAADDEFRTAPLWGLGQRLFFLHDGRTSDLGAAIAAHASPGSEANAVVRMFSALSAPEQIHLLAFLRSL